MQRSAFPNVPRSPPRTLTPDPSRFQVDALLSPAVDVPPMFDPMDYNDLLFFENLVDDSVISTNTSVSTKKSATVSLATSDGCGQVISLPRQTVYVMSSNSAITSRI